MRLLTHIALPMSTNFIQYQQIDGMRYCHFRTIHKTQLSLFLSLNAWSSFMILPAVQREQFGRDEPCSWALLSARDKNRG